MKHHYSHFARPHQPDIDAIKAKTRTLPHRWEFGLIQYDSAAHGSNPDDSKAEQSEYIVHGLADTLERATEAYRQIEMPADAIKHNHGSRMVGIPVGAFSIIGGGRTPNYGGNA